MIHSINNLIEVRLAFFITLFLGVVQFVYLPFLGGVNGLSKQIVFCFFTLCLLIYFYYQRRFFILPRNLFFPVILIASFLASCFAYFPPDSFLIFVSIVLGYLYLILVFHLDNTLPDFREKIIDSLIISGTIAAVLGFYQLVSFLSLGYVSRWLIPSFLPSIGGMRVAGIYGQPNLFSLFLLICLMALFYRYIHFFVGVSSSSGLFKFRFILPLLIAIIFFLTGSRSGLLSLILILGLLCWLTASSRYLERGSQSRYEFFRLLFTVVAAFLLTRLWLFIVSGNVFSRGLSSTGMSADARFIFWTAAVMIFLDHPWLGVGLDNFKFFLPEYQLRAHDFLGFVEYESMIHTKWVHNEYIQLLCEGGVVVFLPVLTLLFIWCYFLYKNIKFRKICQDPWLIYGNLLIFPFILQSFFSYPLRYAPLWAVFLTLFAFVLPRHHCVLVKIPKTVGRLILVSLCLLLLLGSGQVYMEKKIGELRNGLRNSKTLLLQLDSFVSLANNPYCKSTVLQYCLLPLVRYAVTTQDRSLSEQLLPYIKEATELQGVYWQWFYLAQIYHLVGRESSAYKSIRVALDRRPSFDPSWYFLHYLDVASIAKESGRPINSYYPSKTELQGGLEGNDFFMSNQ